jgi:hypothetical protein
MRRLFASLILIFLCSGVQAADEVGNWYFDGFPGVQLTPEAGVALWRQKKDFCERYATSDLTAVTQIRDNTAMGKKLVVLSDVLDVNSNVFQCSYFESETVNTSPVAVYLYVYTIEQCAEDEEFSKSEHICVPKEVECAEGDTSLRSGVSSHLIATAPYTVYVNDQTPSKMCLKYADSAKTCIYNKPSSTHSCYSDQPLPYDVQGYLPATAHYGHCNYEFTSTAEACTQTASNDLPNAWGGYSLSESTTPTDITCAPGIEIPGCPIVDGSGATGGSGGTGGGDGTGSTGGTGDGGGTGGGGLPGDGDCTLTGCTGTGGGSGGDGSDDDEEDDCPTCTAGNLTKPTSKGSFADAIASMDSGIQEGKTQIKTKVKEVKELLANQTSFQLESGDGRLQCDSVHIETLKINFELCLSAYADQLAGLKYFILFIATLIAFFIIFKD